MNNKPMAKPYSPEKRQLAKKLFLRGYTMEEIRAELNITTVQTLYTWRELEQWDASAPTSTVEEALSRRICQLADRDKKTELELKELDTLCKRLESLAISQAKAAMILKGPIQTEEEIKEGKRERKEGRKKKIKNDISGITHEQLDEIRNRIFYSYQNLWWEIKQDPETRRTRFILKSRQIGATYYFAWEALEDAIKTGDNQIFLSASRDQAEVFRAYIIAFGREYLNIEFTGNPMLLSNGAEIRFLSTNSRTAQSYHGHLYVDEVFWLPWFKKLWKVASGMSAHKRWRRTLFSTPSALSHEAYPMWSGEQFNKGKPPSKQIEIDLSHETLKNGALGADKIWRHIVTVEDAEAAGCDLFDISELRGEYSPEEFDNLFMCRFIDDSESVFPLSLLLNCTVDKGKAVDIDDWEDFKPNNPRPLLNKPVSIGYDPSRNRDPASKAVLSIPMNIREKWRLLKMDSYHKQSFEYQANRIKEDCDSFNVVHCGIDTTGDGEAVFQRVTPFYPQATPIYYSPAMKNQLVVKALDVIQSGRFLYSPSEKGVTLAFLMIRRTTTPSGQITYAAARTQESGHADPAWAIMHGMIYEPLVVDGGETTVSFSRH